MADSNSGSEQEPEDEGREPSAQDPLFPDDLSEILGRLAGARKSKNAARRLANTPLTRAYLDAGLRLIAEQLSASDEQHADVEEDPRPFFSWLSRAKVLQEASRADSVLHPTQGTFRDRWEYQSDYIEDLMSYSLWARHWSLHVSEAQESADELMGGDDFVRAIHEVAYRDLATMLDYPAYRVSIIGSAVADRDPRAREAVNETYRLITESWRELYIKTLDARGLKLRPDVSIDDLTNMLTAFAEGLGLRLLSDESPGLVDHEKRESLLGKAAMALLVSCVDPGDEVGLEELVRMFTQPPSAEPE